MIQLTNAWALYMFAILVPVIILYLLRPKPKELKVPSLMFIMEIEHKKRFSSFFRRIIRDPLLLLQLAALSLIVLAMVNPFYTSTRTVRVEEDVAVVLDVSASMQAGNRFAQAKEAALSVISGLEEDDKVSLILAENVPVVALRQGSRDRALDVLGGIGPKATTTGLGGAILLASDIIAESEVKRRIYVFSDFSGYEGIGAQAAQKRAFAKGISVEFIGAGKPEEGNLAIVNARSGRTGGKCFAEAVVRNYASSEAVVGVSMAIDGSASATESKTLSSDGSEVFYLESDCGSAAHSLVVSLDTRDALPVDDKHYARVPEEVELEVLLVREGGGGKHIKYALEALRGVSLDEVDPPVYPQSYGGYDVVVFQEAEPKNILDGTFHNLREFVEGGGSLIILGFPGLEDVRPEKLADLLPVEAAEQSGAGAPPEVMFDHRILRDVDLEETHVGRFVRADDKVGSITLARVLGSPFLTLWDVGQGRVVFLGSYVNASWSDFHLKTSFPIFWYDTLLWLSEEGSGRGAVNFRTGEQLPLLSNRTKRVEKPSGEVVEGMDILLDEAGFYEVEGGVMVAASLLDEEESDISFRIEAESVEAASQYSSEEAEEEVVNELFWVLGLAALGLVLLEWFYYKRRGSL